MIDQHHESHVEASVTSALGGPEESESAASTTDEVDVAPGQETVGIKFDDGDENADFLLRDVRLPNIRFTKAMCVANSRTQTKESEWPFFVRVGWAVSVAVKHKPGLQPGVVTSCRFATRECVVRACDETELLDTLHFVNKNRRSSNHVLGDSELVVPLRRLHRWWPSQLAGLCTRTCYWHCVLPETALKARFTRAMAQLHRMGLVAHMRVRTIVAGCRNGSRW